MRRIKTLYALFLALLVMLTCAACGQQQAAQTEDHSP